MTEVLTYEALKAERDALERQLSMSEAKCKGYFSDAAAALVRCDALAVENSALKKSLIAISLAEPIDGETIVCDFDTLVSIAAGALTTPATDAALAAIHARFCELLDTYGKVEPERFNPEFADLYAKIANRIFSSVMDNPHVIDIDSMTEWLEISAVDARAYADMSIKFHAELREAK
ncbi:TPA: hypothetical protein ACXI3L_001488 [Serratia marcescens]|nr:hypothetical protein [Serratia marcescens]HEJ8033619.1 hypothetical protein [Serratia marcescens]